jgi:hypothetical protein
MGLSVKMLRYAMLKTIYFNVSQGGRKASDMGEKVRFIL